MRRGRRHRDIDGIRHSFTAGSPRSAASDAWSTSARSSVRRASGPARSSRIVASDVMGQWFTIKGLVTSLILLLCVAIFSNTFSAGAFPAILPELGRSGGLADWQLGTV